MNSSQKVAANRINAANSTGPRSEAGKAVSCTNAVRHGVLADVVAVGAQEQTAFDALLAALDEDLRPVGPLEGALVEKIALAIWRNRRLAQAEWAELALQMRPARILQKASREVFGSLGPEITEDDLEPIDPEALAWSQAILDEYGDALNAGIDDLLRVAPNIHGQLVEDVEAEDPTAIAAYLTQEYSNGLVGYILELVRYARQQAEAENRRPEVRAMASVFRDRSQLLPMPTQQLLARYQTMLDGQLYNAVQALKEAQSDRRSAIDADMVDETEVDQRIVTAT